MDLNDKNSNFLPDMPSGSLDFYRSQSTFDWKHLAIKIHTEEMLKFKLNLWSIIMKDPTFDRSGDNDLTIPEYRELTFKRSQQLSKHRITAVKDMLSKPIFLSIVTTALGMYDWSTQIKHSLLYSFCITAIQIMGTEKHLDIVEKFKKEEFKGCLCLTEIGHGSNVRGIRTTATFSPEHQGFFLNTPDFEAAKVWSGNLAKSASHAVVYAKLVTPDGVDHGVHTFILAIRDPHTFKPFTGITIGDMGSKLGLNGLDNGFMLFDQYFIPKDALLNKQGDVKPDGEYTSPYKTVNERFGITLGNFSVGRVGIMNLNNTNLIMAIIIAIRYSGARKQFGEDGDDERPILEYQMQQCRLIPHLATAYVHHIFSLTVMKKLQEFQARVSKGESSDTTAAMGIEIHGISSIGKPMTGWAAQQAIQECREACGGHGYLACSRFGELRGDNDAYLTLEGDNNVLQQQTSQWLLGLMNKKTFTKGLGYSDFIHEEMSHLINVKVSLNSNVDIKSLLLIYKALIAQLLRQTRKDVKDRLATGQSQFDIRNDTQKYQAHTLSIVFGEYLALKTYSDWLDQGHWTANEQVVMTQLAILYAVSHLEKHVGHLFSFGIFKDSGADDILHQLIIKLCKDLTPNAVSLVDILAPPDKILNSALGCGDGDIYRHLRESFMASPDCFTRAPFWEQITKNLNSKL